MLKFMAVVPFDGRPYSFVVTRFLVSCQCLWIAMFTSTFLGYGIVKFRQGIYEVDYICEGVVFGGVYLRYVLLFCRRSQFATILHHCDDLWMNLIMPEKRIIYEFVNMVHHVVYFLLITSTVATIWQVS